MGWVEDALARQKGATERQQAVSAADDAGYVGGFISSVASGVGEMFGMEPFPTAERFRAENPIGGFISEFGGAIVPYVGWESAIARAPRLGAALGGAAERIGISATAMPVRHGIANMTIRYAPVELSRLGAGMFITDDWDKYSGLMADVGLSTMLAGGIGGLGGFLRAGGKAKQSMVGHTLEAPQGLAAPFEYRIALGGRATPANPNESMQSVTQNLFRESLNERPIANKAVHALAENSEPRAVVGLNVLFKESNSVKGLQRQKLMQNDGTFTLGQEGNQELLAGLGRSFKSMEDVAAYGRFTTVVTPGSDRAAGTLRKAVEGLSPVGDGAFIGQEVGDGLFVVGVRTKLGDAAKKAAIAKADLEKRIAEMDSLLQTPASKGKVTAIKAEQKKLYQSLKKSPPASQINTGDQWVFVKTDRPDLYIRGVSKSTRKTVNEFAKYRDAYRPEVNQDTLFNQVQNRVIQTFTPQNLLDIKAGRTEKARMDWMRRMTSKTGEGLGIKDSEMLHNLWAEAYDKIAPSMTKGIRNSLYDRNFMMLMLNKQTGESLVNRMIGGAVRATRRARFGVRQEHVPEVAPGIETLNKLMSDNSKLLTEADYRLFDAISTSQTPKELVAELTSNGQVSVAAQNILRGVERLDKYFWEQMMPVAKALGLETKFNLLEGPYLPRLMKGDWYVAVTDESGRAMKYLASGTRKQAQENAAAFVKAAEDKGLKWMAKEPRSWYEEGDELVRIEKAAQLSAMTDPKVAEIARAALRQQAIAGAGIRQGVMKARMPATLTTERTGIASSTGGEFTAKQFISDIQQHYGMIAKYLGHQSWMQRWMPEMTRLKGIDEKMYNDVMTRGRQMLGYEGKQAQYLNNLLKPVFGPALGGKAASKIAQEANSMMYHWNIGLFNPVFAIVNLLTPLQTVAPWIAMMKTAPQAADDLMHTTLRFNAEGKPAGIFNTLDVPKIMLKSLREIGRPGDELLDFLGRAKTEGTLSPQMFENFGGHGSAASVGIREAYNRAGGGVAGFWEGAKKSATWASTHSEEWSREYAFTAGYVVGRDVVGLKGEALYRFAQRATHVTMYGYHAMDRSMLFTGPLGSMFGLFKNWQMHFISSMFQYAGLGWREGNWAPLIWQFAGSLAVGGLGATPLVLVADRITDWMDNQPNSYLWMKENFGGPDISDELYYGFPAMFGLSLQASSALPGTDVRNDITMLSNFVFFERAKAAFKATKGAWDYGEQTGQNPLRNENVRDALLQGFAPRALWRLFSTTEGDAIKSMSSGYPQIRNVAPGSQLAYSLGFNPVEIEEQQDAARYMWRDQTAQREAIAAHGMRLAEAELNRDPDEIMRVVRSAMVKGLPMSSVTKSAQTRLRREQQQDLLTKYGGEGHMARMVLGEE